MRTAAAIFTTFLFTFTASCGGKSPTSPSSRDPLFTVAIFNGGSQYTATFNGKTYSDLPQNLQVRLAPGTYTIEGSFRGPGSLLTIGLATSEGSVVTGSFRVTQGPSGTSADNCGATFINNSLGTANIPFRLEFRVQSSATGSCRVG